MAEFQGPSEESITQHMQAQENAPTAEPSSSAPVGTAPQGGQPSVPEPAAAPVPDDVEEFEFEGTKVPLSKSERAYLIRMGVEAYRNAELQLRQQQEQQPQAQPEAPQQQTDFQKAIQQEVERQTKEAKEAAQRIEQWERQTAVKEILRQADEAIGKDPILKDVFANGSTEEQNLIKAFTVFARREAPNAPWSQVTTKISQMFGKHGERMKAALVKAKVEQSARRVEGAGGAVPTAEPKPFTKADWNNGRLEAAAVELLRASQRD